MRKNIVYNLMAYFILLICFSCTNLSISDNTDNNLLLVQENNVTKDEAIDVAKSFLGFTFNSEETKVNNEIESSYTVLNEGTPVMHIINYSNGGFVIVSATKEYYPILAYSNTGSYDLSADFTKTNVWFDETSRIVLNANMISDSCRIHIKNDWERYKAKESSLTLSSSTKITDTEMELRYQERISELQEELGDNCEFYRLSEVFDNGSFQDTEDAYMHYCDMAREVDSPLEYTIVVIYGGKDGDVIGPLLSTHWGQNNGYNGLCKDNIADAGCCTVTLAQLMKFHQFPANYDWLDMQNHFATEATQILYRDINNVIGKTSDSEGEKLFLQDNGYSASIVSHDAVSVKNHIVSYRNPVIMGGAERDAIGHSWLCDGVDYGNYFSAYFIEFFTRNSYGPLEFAPSKESPTIISSGSSYSFFHMNWGWCGLYDGWFIDNDINILDHVDFSEEREDIYVSK